MGEQAHPCQVCSHPDRLAIEAAMLAGKGMKDLCRQFQIGSRVGTPEFIPDHKKLTRHRDTHMQASYQAAMAGRLVESGNAMVDRLGHLNAVVDETMTRLRKGVPVTDEHGTVLDDSGNPVVRFDNRAILAAVAEARRNVEVEARLMGALPEGDPDAVAQARAALTDPAARKLIADLEDHLAEHRGV